MPSVTLAQLAFIGVVKYIRASTAAVLGATEILFASVLGVALLHQSTNVLAVAGNVVVFAGTLLVAKGAARERRASLEGAGERAIIMVSSSSRASDDPEERIDGHAEQPEASEAGESRWKRRPLDGKAKGGVPSTKPKKVRWSRGVQCVPAS